MALKKYLFIILSAGILFPLGAMAVLQVPESPEVTPLQPLDIRIKPNIENNVNTVPASEDAEVSQPAAAAEQAEVENTDSSRAFAPGEEENSGGSWLAVIAAILIGAFLLAYLSLKRKHE